jgi:hypothetical protein
MSLEVVTVASRPDLETETGEAFGSDVGLRHGVGAAHSRSGGEQRGGGRLADLLGELLPRIQAGLLL